MLSKAKLDESEAGPFKIETMSLAADDSSDTKQNEKSTTVTVAGDVTFATDSDQLSAQADSVLASVVEQVKKYPSGGDLTITGHTDDVADDAHNQDLSERRAGKTVHMVIDHVVRAGNYLVGTVVVTSSEKVSMPVAPFSLPGRMMEMRGLSEVFGVSGITILSGGLRHLEADYTYSDGSRYPLANSFVYDLEPEASQSLPVVWPDVGEDSITIDMPAGEYLYTRERVVARLTDIPVVNV